MSFDSMDKDATVEVGGVVQSVAQGVEQEIPLSHLFLSQQNVRKVRDPETIPELAATIKAQGLLSRLAVVPERIKGVKVKGETFGVVAGGRRLAALQMLAQKGELPPDVTVKCLVFTPDRAVAVSLTENTTQERMLGRVLRVSCMSSCIHRRWSLCRRRVFDARPGKLARARVAGR
jgi:ParB family transcriptional regulator, chromosome partitioning protein